MITNTPGPKHMPGYAGHIPGLDAGTSKTFGNSTSGRLQDMASTIKSYSGDATQMSRTDMPRERGLPFQRSPRTVATPQPSADPKVPGYTGTIPGRQHVYAQTYGGLTAKLAAAHATSPKDKNAFISYSDARPSTKDTISMSPRKGHVPGYAGHIPGLDAGSASTFGSATKADLQKQAANISPTGARKQHMAKIAMNDIPRERGHGSPAKMGLAPRAAPPGTEAFRKEARLPGYTGYQAGSQHLFADTYGRSTATLRAAHVKKGSDKNEFLTYGENRTSQKANITSAESTVDTVTSTSSRSHVPGYSGHCPTTRDAVGQRFGVSTAPSLYSKSQKSVWYTGDVAGTVAKSELPREMGLPRSTSATKPQDTSGRLPGYTGFVQHAKDTFAKTYGQTTRQLQGASSHNQFTTCLAKPFGQWVLAGNNDGTNHLPGYAGHVAGNRDRVVGQTFGSSTKPEIFNAKDRAAKGPMEYLPSSSYHSGLRMHGARRAAKPGQGMQFGSTHWNTEHTTTSQVYQQGQFMP